MLDEGQVAYLRAQHLRNLRVGGRAPSRTVVTLVMLVVAALPEMLIFPLGSGMIGEAPHLGFVCLSPVVLANGMPFTAIVAVLLARRWMAPVDRRYAVVLAGIVAGVLRMSVYAVAIIGDATRTPEMWWALHLIETTMWVGAIIALAFFLDARQPPYARPRLSLSESQDPQHSDRSLFETAVNYIRSSCSRRRAHPSAAERRA